jgi:nitroreductase
MTMPDTTGCDEPGAAAESRLAARYGAQPRRRRAEAAWNAVLDTLLAHRSVRHFSDRALPEGLPELLAAAAQSAPSSSNLQAFSIVAVEDAARRARLAALAAGQHHVAQAPLLLVFVADLARLRAVCAAAGEAAAGLDYLESFIVAVADAAFAAQNALVALESLGLGGCYIGALRNHPRAVAEELGLPPGAFAVFGLTVGYPDPDVATGVKPRLPQPVVLHRERYRPARPEAIAAYDAGARVFRHGQSMPDIAWSRLAAARVRGPESLMGRHTMRETLRAMGFALT